MKSKTKRFIFEMYSDKIMPGCNTLIHQAGRTEYLSLGYTTFAKEKEVSLETIYDLASLTKVIGTTTVILQLWEQGKLQLTDKVSEYLPITSTELTILDLLHHTSDFQGYIPNRNELPAKALKQALLTEIIPGEFRGQKIKYSDINFLYLGWIAEVITKQDIQTLITENVIKLLGTTSLTFNPDFAKVAPTSLEAIVHDPKARILQEHCGSAGLFGSVIDVYKFIYAYLHHGKKVRTLGWVVEEYEDDFIISHTGYTGTYLACNLSQETCFIFLSNRVYPHDDLQKYLSYRDQLIKIYLSEEKTTTFK